jgi:Lytic polysaccharide mono-oxygenase, cellulose-degrading
MNGAAVAARNSEGNQPMSKTASARSAEPAQTAAPEYLRAAASERVDGRDILRGIQLQWKIGQNDGGDWPEPGDWDQGKNPPYPHLYEVWLDGEIAQTVALYWPPYAPGWQMARTHWVCLGTHPETEYAVKIRARLGDGTWTAFTNEVTVTLRNAQHYVNPFPKMLGRDKLGSRHGSVDNPASRVIRAIRDRDPSQMCERARQLITSTTWQEVVPPEAEMLADPPWNGSYLQYRKFFDGPNVPSASNPVFAGLDLPAEPGLDWPVAQISGSAAEHTFSYTYHATHTGPSWTHQWFVTKDGWDPQNGVSLEDLEPIPFMIDTHGDDRVTTYTTAALAARAKSGRHAIVNVWGGHGGPRLPDGTLAGEFFLSCSDVIFT